MNYEKEIEILLKKLPHKLQVKYALYCAESVFHLVKDEDKPVVRKSLDTAALWLVDKASADEVYAASSAISPAYAASVAISAVYAATAATAATAASYAAASASAISAAYAARAAVSASTKDKNNASKHYYKELIRMIKDLTELDKLIYDLTDKEFL